MVTGTPGAMRAASQLMLRSATLTQPCETAVPSVPPMFASPCKAIWPGPAGEFLKHRRPSAQRQGEGAPALPGGIRTASSTKNRPCGVGVDGLPDDDGEGPD